MYEGNGKSNSIWCWGEQMQICNSTDRALNCCADAHKMQRKCVLLSASFSREVSELLHKFSIVKKENEYEGKTKN